MRGCSTFNMETGTKGWNVASFSDEIQNEEFYKYEKCYRKETICELKGEKILNLRIPAELGQNDFKKLMTLINHWNCNEIKWRNIKWRILQIQTNVKRLYMKGRVKNSYFDLRIPAELGQNGFKMELEAFDFGKPLKLKWIKSNSGSSNFIFQNHTRVFFKSIPDRHRGRSVSKTTETETQICQI